jgi:diaminopimelate decarboxylase
MGGFTYRDGVLHCEGVPLDALAERVGTPFYAYSRRRLLANLSAVQRPLPGRGPLVCFALKANSNPHIVRLFAERGAGADIVSGGELALALRCGVPPGRIVFSGAGKTDAEIAAAVAEGILAINVESAEELRTVNRIAGRLDRTAGVSMRVNPRVDPKTHPYIATGLSGSKFGVPAGEAAEVCRFAASLPRLRLVGLHCHIGSMVLETGPYEQAADFLAGLLRPLLAGGSAPLRFVDIGGGLGIDYVSIVKPPRTSEDRTRGFRGQAPPAGDRNSGFRGPAPRHAVTSPEALFKAVWPRLREFGLDLVFEPGRYLVADACVLVTSVTLTKSSGAEGRRFAVVDAGMNDLIRPSLYDAYHQIVPVRWDGRRAERRVDVVGPICESGDFFAHDRPLQEPRRGDLLAVTGAGAYGYSLASNYNGRPRAAEVLVRGNGFRVIRKREDASCLWRGTELDPESGT